MSIAYRIPREKLSELVEVLMENYLVYAPVEKAGNFVLSDIEDPAEVTLEYVRTINSVNSILLPPKEYLFKYRAGTMSFAGKLTAYIDVEDYSEKREKPLCLFGIHPCEAHAIKYLDKVFLTEPKDPYYESKRRDIFIAVVLCDKGDENCFCIPFKTYIPPEDVDLVMSLDEDSIVLQLFSEKGKEVVSKLEASPTEAPEINPPQRAKKIDISVFDSLTLEKVISGDISDLSEKCVLCQACTAVCPTCYCFDLYDEPDPEEPGAFFRVRRRATCHGLYYSRLAGGEVILEDKESRFKWRILHKFVFSKNMYGCYGCIGCGKCTAFCPAGIDFIYFIEKLQG